MKNYNRLLCLLLAPLLFIFSACTFIEKKRNKRVWLFKHGSKPNNLWRY